MHTFFRYLFLFILAAHLAACACKRGKVTVTVNPPATLSSVTPNAGEAGKTVVVTLTGSKSNFVQGSTQADFGSDISVGGATEGSYGPVTVTGLTSAQATVTINPHAGAGLRIVSVRTGAQAISLADGFSVIIANQLPTANPGGPYSGIVGTAVAFDGAGSADPDHDPLTSTWTFGDGVTATGATPSHTYSTAGTFTVTLTVDDGRGGIHASSTAATIAARNQSPTATPGGPYAGSVGQAIVFNGTGSIDPDHDPLTLSWNFGDGGTGTGATPSHTYAAAGTFTVTLTVADGRGGTNSVATTMTVSAGSTGPGLPLDPAVVAPPLSRATATSLASATEFLYTGASPIQTGVAPATIESRRAAVLRGKVLGRDGTALTAVEIDVLGHPEFGQTLTRADGAFDLAVNGGGQLTVRYEKDGFLAAQRSIVAPWSDYAWLPDVVMIPFDTAVTTVDLSSAAMQVARGSAVSDADGARQATVLIPAGTGAEMVLPDGSKQSLTTLHVRATEYTVGPNGPQAMPAPLPPSSGYTYAAELSVDEAVAAGAKGVAFSQPVINYVENFLNFPVGGIAPVGFYDKDRAAWVPSTNGRVVRILSAINGLASLDIDGSGQPASATALATFGATDAERQQLAILYPPGQSVWRVPIGHFSPTDINWPYGPPSDATVPQLPSPQGDDPLDDGDCSGGSLIECQNQVLREQVPLVGTALALHYRSDRAPGRRSAYTLSIPLSSATVPPSLKRIDLVVEVAGQRFTKSFPGAANQRTTFTWDGRDGYGRPVQGQRPVSVRIGYVYGAVYLQPGQGERSFTVLSYSGVPISANVARQEVTLWQEWRGSIGPWDARAPGMGGWTLSVHHAYDPAGKVLHLGDGGRRSARSLPDVITTVAGDGNFCSGGGPCGNGGPAAKAQLTVAATIAVGPDGSLYIPDRDFSRIRRVAPNGIITTIAGSGNGFSGDGGPATSARLASPQGVAIGPDGSLYIADTGNHRIRRIGLDGIITTVAGNGTVGRGAGIPPGDGGPATQAQVDGPVWITVGPDGSLYIAHPGYYRIRKVSPDGVITTLAGTAQRCVSSAPCGDSGPASLATFFSPQGIALGPDGSLYVADTGASRIRRIAPDGRISTVAGRIGGPRGFEGDGGPATDALFNNPQTVAVGPDGSLYIADENNHRIRRVGPEAIITTVAGAGYGATRVDGGPATQAILSTPNHALVGPDGSLYIWGSNMRRVLQVAPLLPGFAAGDLVLAAEDGSEVYVFDNAGRHLRTLHALTGALLYDFRYDSASRLATVTDGNGNVTTIERDAGGNLTGLVGPFGQRTSLTVGPTGYLERITNPAGEAYSMTYTADGLLTKFTDPKGNASQMTYDALGRLTRDTNAAGGFKLLARTDTDRSFTTSVGTSLGRTTGYQVERLSTGDQRRGTVFPDGTQTHLLIGTDGGRKTTLADGTITNLLEGPDARFSMRAPLPKSLITTTGGLTSTLTTTSTANLTAPNDPLTLTNLADTVTLNGRIFKRVYDASTKTATRTSAAGRLSKIVIDSLGRVVQSQRTGLLANNLTYDTRGRLASVTQGTGADARTAILSYNTDGYLDTLTDPLGRTLSFAYDAAGRVTRQTLPDGRAIVYGRDVNGNLTSLTPSGRPAHLFSYTPVDLQGEYTPPAVGAGSNSTRYAYNLDKQLTRVTRPDGQFLDFGYDGAGRPSTLTLPTGQIGYAYDATTGKVTRVTAPDGGALAFTYNGALLTQTAWAGTVAGKVSRDYDNDLRVTSLSVNGTDAIAFEYDEDSLLKKAGNLTLSRNAQNGLLTATTLGNVTVNLGYNGFGEVTAYSANYGGSEVFKTLFSYDKLGRITTKTETVAGATVPFEYDYDVAGRLKEVKKNGTVTATYSYDSNGNRLTAPGLSTAPSYDDQDRLTQYGGTAYSYAANGELKAKTAGALVTSYDYDLLGNLKQVALSNATTIDYVVDGQNRRIGKKVNGVLVQAFLYQSQLRPVAEMDGAGRVVSRFLYATRGNVPDYMIKGGATYRIIADHLGSPRLVVDTSTGVIVQRMDYDEFGKVLLDTNRGFQPFGFAGGIYDTDTGLVRFGARDYDGEIGRWTAKDPILFAGADTNLYGYVLDDPVNEIDPSGLWISQKTVRAVVIALEIALNKGKSYVASALEKNQKVTRSIEEEVIRRNKGGACGPGGPPPGEIPSLGVDDLFDLLIPLPPIFFSPEIFDSISPLSPGRGRHRRGDWPPVG